MTRNSVLLLDDEPGVRAAIRNYLEAHGLDVVEAQDCRSAEEAFVAAHPDLAILDYQLPDGSALDLLPRLRAIDSVVPIIILTGFGSIDLAVRAIKEGADQFLTKPVELPALVVLVERLIEARREHRRQLAVRASRSRDVIDPFLGSSQAIRELADRAQRILASESPILILGETGTGKGVVARWLHEHGPRAAEAFVDVNCAALTREFLETELFGHEKGAYTGAVTSKQGLFEVADRGTVFLDEIGDVDVQVQPKLLKVIEEGRFRRLGAVRDRQVDVHLLAATHQNLAGLVREQRFRSDLYYRVGAIVLEVPPLRQRGDDVLLIADYYLRRLPARLGRDDVRLAPDAAEALRGYAWPGNIRELHNIIERAVLLSDRPELRAADLGLTHSPQVAPSTCGADSALTLEEVERRQIETVLREEGGRIEPAARRLGIHRSSLYSKIKRYGLAVSRS
jgi:DNA-binding NtrC family response regulator